MQSSWVLEPVTYQGLPYLLDRATSMVYANNQGWLQLVGQWQGGVMLQRKRNNTGELFKALDDLLRTNQVRTPPHQSGARCLKGNAQRRQAYYFHGHWGMGDQ